MACSKVNSLIGINKGALLNMASTVHTIKN